MINRLLAPAGRILAGLAGLALIAFSALPPSASAQELNTVRDAEIEATIRAYADPIFDTAGLDASGIRVILVQDKRINAFVAGGLNLFINTGLLMEADRPNQVIGVIAHETGHIAGAHLSRIQEELENATIQQIIAMVAGAAAGVASGNPEIGAGTMQLGRDIVLRNILKYSRTQESAADQAALRYLDATGQSARGLLEFFEKLEGQEYLLGDAQDPYLRTHPLTADRVDAVRAHVATSPYADAPDSPEFVHLHQRMLAKLRGYLLPGYEVDHYYPKSDQSAYARYARAIALYRASRLKEAARLMDSLLAEAPDDPYYLEQKGQILRDGGDLAGALPLYRRAAELLPQETLLAFETAQIEVESEDRATIELAIRRLEMVVGREPRNAGAWYYLSIAYGRAENFPMSALASAEHAMALGSWREGWGQAKRAIALGLREGTPGWLRAQDIIAEAQQRLDMEPEE